MLKKTAFVLVGLGALPFLNPHFRRGVKEGWNAEVDKQKAEDPRLKLPKFKNV